MFRLELSGDLPLGHNNLFSQQVQEYTTDIQEFGYADRVNEDWEWELGYRRYSFRVTIEGRLLCDDLHGFEMRTQGMCQIIESCFATNLLCSVSVSQQN